VNTYKHEEDEAPSPASSSAPTLAEQIGSVALEPSFQIDECGAIETYRSTPPIAVEPEYQQEEFESALDNTSQDVQVLWIQFLHQLLMVGGWTVAVLLALRLLLVPLLSAGNTPVALVLAISIGVFLALAGICPIIRELHQKNER
jgi:hypothetical protein